MLTENVQSLIIILVFVGVIVAIAFDIIDMLLAALLGVSVLIFAGIFTQQDVLNVTQTAGGPIALLFGGMVVARVLAPTGLFEYVGSRYVLATKGSGKRFLLSLFLLVAPVCSILPNATAVILLAPIIIRVARALEVDFVGPMILTAIISNSAGLLTLVGDPATFLIGSSIGMTFNEYLRKVSIGGLLAVVTLAPLLPWLMKDLWRTRRTLPPDLKPSPLERPALCLFALLIMAFMVFLFLFSDMLPNKIVPPAVAIIAASLGLLLVYTAKIEPVVKVLQDLDWRTILFLICLFCLVEAFTKTGIIQSMSQNLYTWFDTRLILISMIILVGVSFTSSLLANIPVVAAMLLMVRSYLVTAELVPEQALAAAFTDWPAKVMPMFVAMMFAGTLGGNATLIGASANVVSVGICASQGKQVSFVTFMRYGVPLTICQMIVSALYVLALFYFVRG